MIEDILLSKYGEHINGIDIYEKESSLILSKIVVNDDSKEEGYGTKIMTDLINYADKNNKIIALTPSADYGGNKNRLNRFYHRFNFKPNKGKNKNFEFREAMIRYPESDVIKEGKINDILKDKVFDRQKFIQNIKNGSSQTKEAYKLFHGSIVNNVDLSDDEKDFINNNLKNIFTALGYGALFMVPGGLTLIGLTKILTPIFKKKSVMNEQDKLKGGLADNKSKKDIANKFGITVAKINKELKMGEDVEMEHVTNRTLSREIAMDHLVEIPDYYTRLKKMEKEGDKYWKDKTKKLNESIRDFIKRRIKENITLSLMDETPVTTAFNIMHKENVVGQIEVGKFNKKLNDDDLEIVLIKIEEQFRGVKLGAETIKALWVQFPDINRFILMPTQESKDFWERIGAVILNDTYYMINRS